MDTHLSLDDSSLAYPCIFIPVVILFNASSMGVRTLCPHSDWCSACISVCSYTYQQQFSTSNPKPRSKNNHRIGQTSYSTPRLKESITTEVSYPSPPTPTP